MRLMVDDLSAERGGEPVFAGISFTVEAGTALIVTGANGSGKSTLLRVIAGLLPAHAGHIALTGAGGDADIAASCHYLGHDNAMKTALSVRENLDFWQAFIGAPLLSPDAALDVVGLGGLGHLPFGALSTGQRRRAAIARLLVSHRPIWLLDEPTAGLDARSEDRFADCMRGHLGRGGLIVAATHVPLGLDGVQSLDLVTR